MNEPLPDPIPQVLPLVSNGVSVLGGYYFTNKITDIDTKNVWHELDYTSTRLFVDLKVVDGHTIQYTGTHNRISKIEYQFAALSGHAGFTEYGVFINGTLDDMSYMTITEKNNERHTVSGCCILTLAPNSTIELRVRKDNTDNTYSVTGSVVIS
jgi:hypothetical protein